MTPPLGLDRILTQRIRAYARRMHRRRPIKVREIAEPRRTLELAALLSVTEALQSDTVLRLIEMRIAEGTLTCKQVPWLGAGRHRKCLMRLIASAQEVVNIPCLFTSLRESPKEFDLDGVDLYHCRHWYITERLLAGESIHLVAKAVGTSVAEIERTYSNVLTEQVTEKFSETIVEFADHGHFKLRKVRLK